MYSEKDISSKFLFNNNTLIDLASKKLECRQFIMRKNNEAVLELLYFLKEDQAIIGFQAPFGAVDSVDNLAFEYFQTFIDNFYESIQASGIKKIYWKHFPEIYNSELSAMTIQALMNLGFIIEGSAINFHLESAVEFSSLLADDTSRRLKKSTEFEVQINTDFETAVFFDALKKWRAQRNIPINISQELLNQQINLEKERYVLFSVLENKKLIAFALGVKINNDVLYKYLPAHDPAYDNFSPVILLTEKMHQYAQVNHAKYLDLGIASEMNGDENFGLIRFKEKLGGRKSMKYTFFKELR